MLNGSQPARPGRVPINKRVGVPQTQLATAIPPFGQYLFVNINIPNSTYVQPNGVNNAGLVTGYYSDASYNNHGFVWQNGAVQTLDYPGAIATFLNGTNNRGVLIGYYIDTSYASHAVTYSVPLSTWNMLPDIPDYAENQGYGINDDGVAVGYTLGNPFGTLAWIWRPDSQSYSFFTAPGAREASTYPFGINEEKQVVGWFISFPHNGLERGFLRKHRREEEYEDANEYENENGTYQNINVPDVLATAPAGINKSGKIAGWFFDANFNQYGFVRTSGGVFTAVNYPGSDGGTQVNGINDHGVLCGNAFNFTSGLYQGFVAYPQ